MLATFFFSALAPTKPSAIIQLATILESSHRKESGNARFRTSGYRTGRRVCDGHSRSRRATIDRRESRLFSHAFSRLLRHHRHRPSLRRESASVNDKTLIQSLQIPAEEGVHCPPLLRVLLLRSNNPSSMDIFIHIWGKWIKLSDHNLGPRPAPSPSWQSTSRIYTIFPSPIFALATGSPLAHGVYSNPILAVSPDRNFT